MELFSLIIMLVELIRSYIDIDTRQIISFYSSIVLRFTSSLQLSNIVFSFYGCSPLAGDGLSL